MSKKIKKQHLIIGDLQGCYDDLLRMLEKSNFQPQHDKLWLAGDIVNRGPQSLQCLRFAYKNRKWCKIVLGNHDLHLIATAHQIRKPGRKDTLDEILQAKDGEKLINWLRHQPLLRQSKKKNLIMVHAGIYPLWSIKKAKKMAKQAEAVLQSENHDEFLRVMYGNQPDYWPKKGEKKLQGYERTRFIINSFTRMRYLDTKYRMDMNDNGAPGTQKAGLIPWFELINKKLQKKTIIFGHWSTLRKNQFKNLYALDSGCVWGNKLTALCIKGKKHKLISLNCKGQLKPGEA